MPRVMCDRTMVEQVLLNLTRNGIQAMETATPLAERRLVPAVHEAQAQRIGFEVRDAGPGISPEAARHLFTPFFTTRAEGMGLGLSLCRTVVEQHGGVLEFAPGPLGRGTVFRFTLPAARAGARNEAAGAANGTAGGVVVGVATVVANGAAEYARESADEGAAAARPHAVSPMPTSAFESGDTGALPRAANSWPPHATPTSTASLMGSPK